MSATQTTDPAPDWAGLAGELHCPLCEYNLRGLVEPRCPECGFAFSWAELLQGQRDKHPYLFEHQDRRNIWSFWKTYWNDCRPRKFWRELNPAQPVRLWRLGIYWFISSLVLLAAPVAQFGLNVWNDFQNPISTYTFYTPNTVAFSSRPPPTFMDHVRNVWNNPPADIRESSLISGSLIVLAWPWLTLICLLIFVQSLRKAQIRKRHVLRTIVYGTDYGLLLLIVLGMGTDARYGSGWPMFIVVVCFGVTLYRVYFAYSRYLRFHLPFATVLSSQIMVFLAFAIVYLQTYRAW